MTSTPVTAGASAEVSGPAEQCARPPSPLRHPAIRGLLLSEAVSATGSQMTTLALPWFVLATTGSVSRMGLVFAAELLPVALLGVPAGLLVARIGVRRTMLLGDAIRAPLIALVPILHAAGVLSFPLLLVMVALAGAVTTPYFAAQRLALPEIVGDDEQLVMRAGGLLEAAVRTAALLGPALAGVLIGLLGATNVLWIDAATFAFSFAVLLPLPRPAVDLSAGAASMGLWSGARAVLGDGLLATVSAASTLYGLFFPLVIASLPVLAELRFGHNAHIAGALLAAWGGGALLGALTVARLAGRMEPMRMGAAAALALDLVLWFFPWHLPVVADGAILAAAGVFTPLLNTPLLALLMTRTSPETRAQAVTFVLSANLLAGPLAFAVSGVLFNAWGIERVLIVVAAGLFVCALLLGRLALPGRVKAPAAAAVVSSESPG